MVISWIKNFVQEPNNIIALFTVVLVFVTIAYTAVTHRLLTHSRRVLMADVLLRTVQEMVSNTREDLKIIPGLEHSEAHSYMSINDAMNKSTASGLNKAFALIDKKLAKKLKRVLDAWGDEAGKTLKKMQDDMS